MLPEGHWITRAPTPERQAPLLARAQAEARHGRYPDRPAETRAALTATLRRGESRSAYVAAAIEREAAARRDET